MIDEYYTWKIFGYHSYDWSDGSHKLIVVRCDICCQHRIIEMRGYGDHCRSCICKTIFLGEANPHYGKPHTEHAKQKMRNAMTGKIVSDETRCRISARGQGIPYEEWEGFSVSNNYCEKFDDACRERIRAKYGYRCFACDKPQDENITKNGVVWKLAVHHVDKNRDQGCNGIKWNLIPLCLHCHRTSHYEPLKSRIEFILTNTS